MSLTQQVRRAGEPNITDLNYEYEPQVLGEDIKRAEKLLADAIEELSGYKEGDFESRQELIDTALDECKTALERINND
ncbi:hypothetical protein CL622_04395 [archaeon]|nr:hypothetical protein [archaeon]|tara:strand:- start:1051 stop:1284 length:234 start_codon:yes stop_codon:yes gene_type:complete